MGVEGAVQRLAHLPACRLLVKRQPEGMMSEGPRPTQRRLCAKRSHEVPCNSCLLKVQRHSGGNDAGTRLGQLECWSFELEHEVREHPEAAGQSSARVGVVEGWRLCQQGGGLGEREQRERHKGLRDAAVWRAGPARRPAHAEPALTGEEVLVACGRPSPLAK